MAKRKTTPARFFIDSDDDGHSYVILATKRTDWEKWLAIPWNTRRYESGPPPWAYPIDDFTQVTFTDPDNSGTLIP